MEKLLELLKDGRARTTRMLAMELHTSLEDIQRKLEYLEHMGVLRRISMKPSSCNGCGGQGEGCGSCLPGGEILNMGEMWEVVTEK